MNDGSTLEDVPHYIYGSVANAENSQVKGFQVTFGSTVYPYLSYLPTISIVMKALPSGHVK